MTGPMNKSRSIEGVYRPPPFHWVGDGFRVAGYFSAIPNAMQKLDPFLMLDYHPAYRYEPTDRPRGVGVHPHRGFETVTIAWQGSVAHHDSTGAGGVIGPGDVQWMTAASGVLHKEYHERNWARGGGLFQMAQLWVNLPAAKKKAPPGYQALTASDIPQVPLSDNAGFVRVIAGEFQGTRGPAKTHSPMSVLDARVSAGGRLELSFPASYHLSLLVMQGELSVVGQRAVGMHDFVVFHPGAEDVVLEAASDAQLLILSGEPIGEPIVPYGPFVMNSEREILEAIRDFQSGKFGHLSDDEP